MLSEEIDAAAEGVELDATEVARLSASRHLDALRLVIYKLRLLQQHIQTSRRLLNDLRTLRRLLAKERNGVAAVGGVLESKLDEEWDPPGV